MVRRSWISIGIAAISLILSAVTIAFAEPADLPEPPNNPFNPSAGFLDSNTTSDVVQIQAVVHPAGGNQAQLEITAIIKNGYHIYSLTQAPGGPVRTKIKLDPSDKFQLISTFQPDQPPHRQPEAAFDNLIVESHEGKVVWLAMLELAPGVDAKEVMVKGQVNAQPCDASSCLPPSDFPFISTLGKPVVLANAPSPATMPPPVTIGQPVAMQQAVAMPPPVTMPLTAEESAGNAVSGNTAVKSMSFFWAILCGFAGGLILNIMPCVLPVIGLKVLSFIEQSGHDRMRTFTLNVWYSIGLLSVFLILATLAIFAKMGWGELFSYEGFTITMAAIVFVMGLSFLGVWEIPIPGFVGRGKAAEMASQEGAAGAFSKGVLTTILATPCSGPFLGSALAWIVTQPPMNVYAVFTSMGLGMASPYLLIGAFPELIRFLPKPGAWMETFKQMMGFVLLGTIIFFLTFMPFPAVVPTVALLFGLWASCWWIGRMSLLLEFGVKLRTWIEAVAFAGVIWLIAFRGASGILPEPVAFGSLADYMQERFDRVAGTPNQFTQERLQQLVNSPRTVLVDFTADWCLTCKTLEKAVLNSSAVQAAIRDHNVVMLRADWTNHDAEVTAMLERLGSKQVPVIAVFPPGNFDQPIVFLNGYTQQTLIQAIEKAGQTKL